MPGVLLIMAFWKRIKMAVSWRETTSAVIFIITAFIAISIDHIIIAYLLFLSVT